MIKDDTDKDDEPHEQQMITGHNHNKHFSALCNKNYRQQHTLQVTAVFIGLFPFEKVYPESTLNNSF